MVHIITEQLLGIPIQPAATPTPQVTAKYGTRFSFIANENQRRWIGIGWTSNLLPTERSPFSDENGAPCPHIKDYTLGNGWKWVEADWQIVHDWVYTDNSWQNTSDKEEFGKYTRTRQWKRTAELSDHMEDISPEQLD